MGTWCMVNSCWTFIVIFSFLIRCRLIIKHILAKTKSKMNISHFPVKLGSWATFNACTCLEDLITRDLQTLRVINKWFPRRTPRHEYQKWKCGYGINIRFLTRRRLPCLSNYLVASHLWITTTATSSPCFQ